MSWRPDWKNESAYPDSRNTRNAQWAWEFLRRSPRYTAVFEEFTNGAITAKEMTETFMVQTPIAPAVSFGSDVEFIPFLPEWQDYGATLFKRDPIVPASWNDVVIKFDLSLPLSEQLEVAEMHLRNLQSKERIESTQRLRTDVYPRYLQILDAKHLKVSHKEIAKALTPSASSNPESAERSIDAQAKEAQRLSDRGYKALLMFGSE